VLVAGIIDLILRVGLFLIGVYIVMYTVAAAVRTFVLPRSDNVKLTRMVFQTMRYLFDLRLRHVRTYEDRDRVMAFYAPISLLVLSVVWQVCVLVGYTLMYFASGGLTVYEAFRLSGSSLLTLGFFVSTDSFHLVLEFSEAILGLILIAILISYLPTMYSAFSKREAAVNKLVVRAGSPPSAVEMIERIWRQRGLEYFPELMEEWEDWFVDIEESHSSLAALVFFRSPAHDRSWVTAAGVVLDAAALMDAAIDVPMNVQVRLTIRAGFLALRKISDFFYIEYNPNPKADDLISISRDEFDAAWDHLTAQGLPMKADRDLAWKNFAGWRVNYDRVLLALAALTMAPYAPWVSDRSLPNMRRNGSRIGAASSGSTDDFAPPTQK
jgi:hypothetical protein